MLSRAGAVTLALLLEVGCGSSAPIPLDIGDLEVRTEAPKAGDSTPDGVPEAVTSPGDEAGISAAIPEIFPLSITFKRGRATLDRSAKKTLDEVSGVLGKGPELTLVEVAGHASAKDGKPEKRTRLSRARSRAVTAYLVRKGVERKRLFATHHGDRCPAILTNDPAKDQENRRVEISILQIDGAPIERERSCPPPESGPDTLSLEN